MKASRKTFGPVLGIGVAAAALAAVAAAKPWAVLGKTDAHAAARWVAEGAEVPLASALALAALASWGAILVTRGRLRRGVAMVGTVIALGSLATACVEFGRAPSALRQAAEQSLGFSLVAAPQLSGWFWVALIADTVLVVALAIAVRDIPSWPTMSSRYDAPERPQPSRNETTLDVWKALDRGEDPTR